MIIPVAAMLFMAQGMYRAFKPSKPAKLVTYSKDCTGRKPLSWVRV